MKVVLDTNIILSALLFPDSKPAEIIKMAQDGEIELAISRFILFEIKKNLIVKFNYSDALGDIAINAILKFANIVKPVKKIAIIKEKKSDNRILECAIVASADYLVTGDKKHILPLRKIGRTKIVSVAEFIAIMESKCDRTK